MFQHPHKPRGYLISRVLDYDARQTPKGYIFMSGVDVATSGPPSGHDEAKAPIGFAVRDCAGTSRTLQEMRRHLRPGLDIRFTCAKTCRLQSMI